MSTVIGLGDEQLFVEREPACRNIGRVVLCEMWLGRVGTVPQTRITLRLSFGRGRNRLGWRETWVGFVVKLQIASSVISRAKGASNRPDLIGIIVSTLQSTKRKRTKSDIPNAFFSDSKLWEHPPSWQPQHQSWHWKSHLKRKYWLS